MKSLIINPGSTSTKIAVYEDQTPLWTVSIAHGSEDLSAFQALYDQLPYRLQLLRTALAEHETSLAEIDVIMSRGGLLPGVHAGAYRITPLMVEVLRTRPVLVHAANLGAGMALALADESGRPAYIYDPVTVDEMWPVTKVTGLPFMQRKGQGHNLNMRAVAMAYAADAGKAYDELNVIVAHLGGGITLSLHAQGRIVDMISDDEGPFAPERAGGLPVFQVVAAIFDQGLDRHQTMALLSGGGGLQAYFDTKDVRVVEKMRADGDKTAALVFDAMALNIAKNIAKLSVVVSGQVDAILLTGGIAHSETLTEQIIAGVGFLAPVQIYAGEHEMVALAGAAWRLWRGAETADTYTAPKEDAEGPLTFSIKEV